ncbi:hypothetical protein RhiirC2_792967 [Rhizophagus irregularis]|uniref:Uncharacterized protein n=1 Tax=Rhizophagus irregularis TaxID=588596 RepID=A0A2N1MGI3_9GLOM|nr:hypothetical protein RhiirC2_792967 [Rhizophagus irregularis]
MSLQRRNYHQKVKQDDDSEISQKNTNTFKSDKKHKKTKQIKKIDKSLDGWTPIFCRTPDPWRPGRTVELYLHNKELERRTFENESELGNVAGLLDEPGLWNYVDGRIIWTGLWNLVAGLLDEPRLSQVARLLEGPELWNLGCWTFRRTRTLKLCCRMNNTDWTLEFRLPDF